MNQPPTITINGSTFDFEPGKTILEICRDRDIPIPTLCHDSRLKPYGACRLCIVEVAGAPRPLTSCTTPAENGMNVITESSRLFRLRKTIIELLLSNHPNDCMCCEATGNCDLQELAYQYNADRKKYCGEKWDLPIREDNPFISFEANKCIVCGRCTRICNELVMAGTIEITGRGFTTMPDTAFSRPRSLANCEFCGQCVSTCPTGALTNKKMRSTGRTAGIKLVRTTCSYCGTGCNFFLKVKDERVIGVESDFDSVVNKGNLCIKGRYGYDFIHHHERITTPLIKDGDNFREASWDEALSLVAEKFNGLIDTYGADTVGGFSSSRCTNEENYLLSKWVRTAVGSNNVDNCARV